MADYFSTSEFGEMDSKIRSKTSLWINIFKWLGKGFWVKISMESDDYRQRPQKSRKSDGRISNLAHIINYMIVYPLCLFLCKQGWYISTNIKCDKACQTNTSILAHCKSSINVFAIIIFKNWKYYTILLNAKTCNYFLYNCSYSYC